MQKTDEIRLWQRGDNTVIDVYFVCRSQRDVDLSIRRLKMLATLLPERPDCIVQGGDDAMKALTTCV